MWLKLLGFLALFAHSFAELRVHLATAKLPQALSHIGAIWDGDDSIYLFGGDHWGGTEGIFKYTLSSDTITTVGRLHRSHTFSSNFLSINPQGNIHVFNSDNFVVTEFNPSTQQATEVLNTTIPLGRGPALLPLNESNVMLLIGRDRGRDFEGETIELNLENMRYTYVGNAYKNIMFQFSTFDPEERLLYFFGNVEDEPTFLGRYVLDTQQVDVLVPNITGHYRTPSSRAVMVQGKLFIIDPGQYGGVRIFDPADKSYIYQPVEGMQGGWYTYYDRAAVYVPTLGRIYLFGGAHLVIDSWQDSIFYIDGFGVPEPTEPAPVTTTINPPLFSCIGRPDGFYPHPDNCASFFSCLEEEMTEFNCPEPLLFDPFQKECKHPDQVFCDLTCVGEPDGEYPHPGDCSLFIVCFKEQGEVFQCPSPLFFDPAEGKCNFPHLVNCTTA